MTYPDKENNTTFPLTRNVQLDKGAFVSPEGEQRLQTPWTIHYMSNKTKRRAAASRQNRSVQEYLDNLVYVGTFSSIEGFWRYYSHLKNPSELTKNNRYTLYVFRANLQPAWETFPNGGCWIVKISHENNFVDILWEKLLFNVVGENFWTPELVGVAVSRRENEDIITVWNRDNTQGETRYSIGERLKEILNLDPSTVVEYKFFHMAQKDGSTHANAMKYVYTAIEE